MSHLETQNEMDRRTASLKARVMVALKKSGLLKRPLLLSGDLTEPSVQLLQFVTALLATQPDRSDGDGLRQEAGALAARINLGADLGPDGLNIRRRTVELLLKFATPPIRDGAEGAGKLVPPVCCYCDADLSCAKCGAEQPADYSAPPKPAPDAILEATPAQHVGRPKGKPAQFVRNGKLETCTCFDCRALAAPVPSPDGALTDAERREIDEDIRAVLIDEGKLIVASPAVAAEPVAVWTVRRDETPADADFPDDKCWEVYLPDGTWGGCVAVDANDARDTMQKSWSENRPATSPDQPGAGERAQRHVLDATERCLTCDRTDAEYANGTRSCNDPWHSDNHLRSRQAPPDPDAWMREDGSAATVNPMTAAGWKGQGATIVPLYAALTTALSSGPNIERRSADDGE